MNLQSKTVHLQQLPVIDLIPHDEQIIQKMDFIRKICSSALSIRKKNNIKARVPLQSLTVLGIDAVFDQKFIELIKDEINVKDVSFLKNLTDMNVKTIINIDAKKVAKRIGKDFQEVLKQAKQGLFLKKGDGVEVAGHYIQDDEYEINLKLENQEENYTSFDGKYLVILDTIITKELEMEGIARDFTRAIQNARKENGYNISDQITLKVHFGNTTLEVNSLERDAILANIDYIKFQTLTKEFENVNYQCKNLFCDNITFEVLLSK